MRNVVQPSRRIPLHYMSYSGNILMSCWRQRSYGKNWDTEEKRMGDRTQDRIQIRINLDCRPLNKMVI